MKPLRRVVSTAQVVAFRLDCGHTMHRAPSANPVIPLRIGCDECEQEKYRAFDREQAIAKAVRLALEGVNQK